MEVKQSDQTDQFNTGSQEKSPDASITKESLDEYKKNLMKVHDQLKPQADLFNALKDAGINTPAELKKVLEKKEATTPDKSDEIDFNSLNQSENSAEVKELKSQVENLTKVIQNLSAENSVNKLNTEIQNFIKDKPEFSFLQKALTPQIVYQIMQSRSSDGNATKELSEYLKPVEKDLRNFFQKLGGKIDDTSSKTGDFVETNTERSAHEKITFPTLPTGASQVADQFNEKDFVEKNKNPYTGEFDQKVALEKEILSFVK